MNNLRKLDGFRRTDPEIVKHIGGTGDETCGVFVIPCFSTRANLMVIASSGAGWDHLSVSLRDRTPLWVEMEHVKRTFFRDDEVAMQLHVSPKDHVNRHPYCLHIWRPHDAPIPLPPKTLLVG